MQEDGDKRIAVLAIAALAFVALVGYIVLLAFGRGSEAGLTALFGVVTGGIGALAMFVRPNP